jgi:NADH-quinone oxidoreductase subunit L
MFGHDYFATVFGLGVLCAPLLLLGFLGLCSLIDRPLKERTISKLVMAAVFTGLASSLGIIVLMIVTGKSHLSLEFGNWIEIEDFHFSVKFRFDTLSLPFVILAYVLTGTIGGFANRYMHREPGYNRFFFLYALFIAGMTLTALAGTIETLFAGWEMVGLSSALLVAFFQERPMPVRNGLRVWIVYRVSDAALLIAAVVLHHLHEGDFDLLEGAGGWPNGTAHISQTNALIVGLLLLLAAAGKSALVPFSGWLPRAMEGPTPSSAVFYGAISVHLGAFLLLRVSPILDASFWLSAIVAILGILTAMFGALAGRAQTDIKSALSFASVTQVGIIVAEIGFGLRYIALIHIIGHASLRTLQFLRAPMLLQDYRTLENAIGARLPRITGWWGRWLPEAMQIWLYRFALERGYLDACLDEYIARPFLAVFEWCEAAERKWTDFLTGGPARSRLPAPLSQEPLDELL